ncbi:cellulose biosynthesis cyclic di-GMP-binding regulatory protein BcsB [Pseudomonas sp. 148P]|uniref:Cyclic di-GMP-binding protein n=1 Tax=Pseudomonas ulcerans TaxID=3115852 RepID=A0ABU7HR27_9PSED|nr:MULTISPECIES: cellulose biosynthesis cyclic di-GMP-binding regulatory protein BcsB [unclassified Pseudomonas]MEE1923012.1 cellulose biosynthesis cyclic di-GMP-binding regulatory protein BcsB [Pseudomonas sp. 147P]MEE1933974.1 cellulose biosynthesis cyclic di-GMP-binding regulatory protein BcsB [Pseudomonas sp. 148P]
MTFQAATTRPAHLPRHRRALLACALLLAGAAQAEEPVAAAAAPEAAVSSAGTSPGYRMTFKQLGKDYTMSLKGIESADTVNFDMRADEVVTGAQLTLQYSYSPALLSELSQINILVNDEVAASLPLPKESAGTLQKQTVEIPPYLITEFNRLSVQLIGHYTMQCEDPLHSSLWAKIGSDSQLNIQVSQVELPNDLANLPLPLFDRRDRRALAMPLVFAAAPDNTTLEAAGAVSSWLGALASYRGARFSTLVQGLPASGNGIVLVDSREASHLAGLDLPAVEGPTLSLVSNPNDRFGKLLVIAGRDSEEIKQAATALVLGSRSLSGQSVKIDAVDILPRQPYDAPNWLPSDRPVRLGELAEPRQMNVSGYAPAMITVPLRLPPDLFNWREDGARLNLKYRYTPQQTSSNSSLMVSFNDRFIRSMNLPSIEKMGAGASLLAMLKQDDSLVRETSMLLPLDSVALQSRLQFRFMYDYTKQGECGDIIIDNMRGAIDPDSTLDLSGYEHFMAMPNLGVFKDSGFPFTRLADLSQTAVILPDNAGPADWNAYLTVLGRFGDSTGYPATAVRVAQADEVGQFADKDLLVLASGQNQPLLKQWAEFLPSRSEDSKRYVEFSDLPLRLREWISPDPAANLRKARGALTFSSDNGSSYVSGFESPLQKSRSVVLLSSPQADKLGEVTDALIGGEHYTQALQGSLAVIKGRHIQSLVADEDYYVGQLSPFKYLQWVLSRHVLLLLALTVAGVALVSCAAYFSLRAIARRRLKDQ